MTSNDLTIARGSLLRRRRTLTTLGLFGLFAAACSGSSHGGSDRVTGQSDFESAPMGATNGGNSRGGALDSAGAGGSSAAAPNTSTGSTSSGAPRKVEETDLYRLEGNRLYYLNQYRGLMVFDVTDVDHPRLLARSPIFGSPVEMIVRNGIATVVVADWYGTMDDGTPFHGSIVRGIDANDPSNIKILGEAKLGGWVRDTRVVGDVLYAVSEEYGYWTYGWGYEGAGIAYSPCSNKMVVSSVSFGGGVVQAKGRIEVEGYSGGVFNVTPNAIMFAHDVLPPQADPNTCAYYGESTRTSLQYIDITDPAGTIHPRGHVEFDGRVQGWGTDNGRWNLDFADGKIAHALGMDGPYYGQGSNYVLATADFTNPDAPALASRLAIPGSGWSPAARFDSGRMYLAPDSNYYWGGTDQQTTPLQVYDISVPTAPKLAGGTTITGSVWNFIPSGNRLFALGNDAYNPSATTYGQQISLRYLDVTDAATPKVLGVSNFGQGWAWTPAAGTFKAFTKDDQQGLVVLPFSGWSYEANQYNNGLQLIEFTPTALSTSGVAKTKGWVERGIFVKNRLVSLSDLALSVVDYSVRAQPKIVAELTLARNVVDAQPAGATIAQVSSDWWGNDVDHSELRVLPIAQAEENTTDPALVTVDIEGNNARVFHNGPFSYVVSNVRREVDCATLPGYGYQGKDPGYPGQEPTPCYTWHQQVQIVDLSGGTAVKRGTVELPTYGGYVYWGGWGPWGGCYYYDWYWGGDVLQVGGDALAFRRWYPEYSADGTYIDALNSLFVVDLHDPDAPTVAATRIVDDPHGWWGDMRPIGNTLYTTHYEWVRQPSWAVNGTDYDPGIVRYYLDQIDLSDRSHPKVGAKINVPGILVGGSDTDPSIIYTIDYRWWYDTNRGYNEFDVLKIDGSRAYLQGTVAIPGWVGNTFIQGDHAYMSVQHYLDENYQKPVVQLWQLDLRVPQSPVAQPAPGQKGWGWLLGVQGDRALVTSGWGGDGLDIYRLSDGAAPTYDRFVRTRGWGASSMSRQENQIFLSSGYWGVQTVNLTP
jgi:hypothetical protein